MDSTILAALGTIVAAGGTAITTIYKLLVSKLDDCEKKHSVQTSELIAVSVRVARLEGSIEGAQKSDSNISEI